MTGFTDDPISSHRRSASCEHVPDEEDQSHNQRKMNKCGGDVECHKSQEPQDQQRNCKNQKHRKPPNVKNVLLCTIHLSLALLPAGEDQTARQKLF